MSAETDCRYMRAALQQARRAARRGEVPVGAIVVLGDEIVGRGYNRPIGNRDPTAHAEVVALRRAAKKLDNYRLSGAEVFITLEPCVMCFGAFVHARVKRVVFGARDPKIGVMSGPDPFAQFPGLNHRFEILGGILAETVKIELQAFFAARRRNS